VLGGAAAQTDRRGVAVVRAAAGERVIVAGRVGLRAGTLRLTLRAGQGTAVTARLVEQAAEVEAVVVAAARGDRRVEDTPVRVEVIDEEEIAEQVAMTPGDITMMPNETSGLRVQTTSPSLGGAGLRVQGLRGRYALLLADGLPLYGGRAGGLGLLQIPPVDLGRVEIIKGSAAALYGGAALGGVVNMVSRRPGAELEREALVNQTTRDGTDGVLFAAGPAGASLGYTLLAGVHGQRQNDLDGDGWTDMRTCAPPSARRTRRSPRHRGASAARCRSPRATRPAPWSASSARGSRASVWSILEGRVVNGGVRLAW
jgi:outer membrane receptor protein involved in Fe transport